MNCVLVTGAAQGLGLVTAQVLAEGGWKVLLTDLKPLDAALAKLGGEARGLSGDITQEDFVEQLAAWADDQGTVTGLVNNAGISLIEPAERTSSAQWRRVLDVNLLAPFLLCRAFGTRMLGRRAGSIVNVASIAGLSGIGHRSAYNASKHGLIGLTRTLAAEWGGRGVRVNAVCPGWIKTEMDVADQGSGAYSDADIVNRVPMARFAAPDDVAQVIATLLDPARSAFVNGVSLPVDGGWTADGSWDSLRLKGRD